MEPIDYLVSSIDGDYAYLVREDGLSEEPKLVARALLPEETTEGTRLRQVLFSYEVLPAEPS